MANERERELTHSLTTTLANFACEMAIRAGVSAMLYEHSQCHEDDFFFFFFPTRI